MSASLFLTKAQESLQAAQHLLERDWFNSTANRAYYAVFHATRAALVAAGISSPDHVWSHMGIQAGLSKLVHRRKVYPAQMLADFTTLMGYRELADYKVGVVSSRIARLVVKKASEFVANIEREISS